MDFDSTLKPGLKAEKTVTVDEKNIASAWGSGHLPVFSTPAMIALMEFTSLSAVQPLLPKGSSTVGTELNVKHMAASPIGSEIRCVAELIEVDRRRLVFKVEAFDGAGKIGEGTHGRFIVDNEHFLKKIQQKMEKH
jgi:predicted thioesterase